MKLLAGASLVGLFLCAAPIGHAQTPEAEVSGLMSQYLRLWNAHDAAAITSRIYRLEGNNTWSTEAGLRAEFDRLRAQGYSHSDIFGLSTCMTGPDTAQVELRYARLKTDGSPMPPRDRLSIYRFRRFSDGWRVIGFAGGNPSSAMSCLSR